MIYSLFIRLATMSVLFFPMALQTATVDIPTDASQKTKPATIKVLLNKLVSEAIVTAKGKFRVYNCTTNQMIDFGKDKWGRIVYTKRGLQWGDRFPGYLSMRIVPSDSDSILYVNGNPYKGCLEVHGINGTITIINEVDIENFLKAMIPCKLREKLDKEVLDALVIVERTHFAFLAQKNSKAAWQLSANEINYCGVKESTAFIDEATDRTRGIIMTFQEQLFPATWNRHSAGQTVSYASIFRTKNIIPSGASELPSKSYKEKAKWSITIPKQLLAELAGLKQIFDINLYKAEESSKVYALRLNDGNHFQDIDFLRLQKAIGPGLIRSNDFTVKLEEDHVCFNGYGEGIGSGLCLTSAQILANNQESARNILLIHFPGVRFKSLFSSQEKLTTFVWQ